MIVKVETTVRATLAGAKDKATLGAEGVTARALGPSEPIQIGGAGALAGARALTW